MSDASPTLSPEALRKLEESALDLMGKRQFEEALILWELRLRSGESGLAPFPLYALCLAEVGRTAEARQLCERTSKAIAALEPSERRDQLEQLLRRVIVQLPGKDGSTSTPLPSPDPNKLFGGDDDGPENP